MFQLTLQDEALITVTVSFGAGSIESQHHASWPGLEALRYRNRAMRLVNDRIRQQLENPSDILLLTVVGLISTTLEARATVANAEEKAEIGLHVQGLRALLAKRGGWQALPSIHKSVRFSLRW